MSVIAIMAPIAAAAIGGTFPGVARVGLADPRESAINATLGARTIDIDLGSAKSIDTIFVGYATGVGDITLSYGTAGYTDTAGGDLAVAPKNSGIGDRHYLRILGAPVSARYIRLTATFAAGYYVGNVVIGKSFRPEWGYEYGGGRYLTSTANVQRLKSGSFGIDDGAVVAGWGFTLGDLTDADLVALWDLVKSIGEGRSVLVCEDPDVTAGLHDRIHWGLFEKIEQYERLSPGATKWAFRVSDWE